MNNEHLTYDTMPVMIDDSVLSELETLRECGELDLSEIPDDLLDSIINSEDN